MAAATLTSKEIHLLRLALDHAAAEGEIHNSACMLIESLRRRDVQASDIESALSKEPLPARQLRPEFSPGDVLMPFGKCRGLPLRKIKRSYLRWVLDNCEDLQPELKRAISVVLYGGAN